MGPEVKKDRTAHPFCSSSSTLSSSLPSSFSFPFLILFFFLSLPSFLSGLRFYISNLLLNYIDLLIQWRKIKREVHTFNLVIYLFHIILLFNISRILVLYHCIVIMQKEYRIIIIHIPIHWWIIFSVKILNKRHTICANLSWLNQTINGFIISISINISIDN